MKGNIAAMFGSLKSRILLTMMAVTAMITATFLFFSQHEIEKAITDAEERSAKNVLDLVLLNIENKHKSLLYGKASSLEAHQKKLKDIVSIQENYVRNIYNQFKKGLISEDTAKNRALEELRTMKYGDNDYLWVSDYNSRLVSHPDPKLHNADFSEIRDVRGNLIVPPMVQIAIKEGKGYHSYWWRRLGRQKHIEKLSYFVHFPEWKWVMGTGVYIDDIELEYQKRFEIFFKDLRNSISKVKIAKTGYIYIFNGKKQMLIHPNIKPESAFSQLKNPVTGKYLADELITASRHPYKAFEYLWDKPGHEGDYRFWKYSYVSYFEPLDWYIASSVYHEELEMPAVKLREKILYLLIIISIFVFILSIFLSKTLTDPIKNLINIMEEVKVKGLTPVKVPIRGTTETKIFGEIFSSMLEHLLVQTEKITNLTHTFEKFVPKQFLNRIATDGVEKIQLGKAESDFITILFSDIRSFTNLSENMSPQEVLNFLNAYFKRMNEPIHKHHGFIDKFIGDAIMALFDRPEHTNEDEAIAAVQAAIAMQKAVTVYNQNPSNSRYFPISIGIGIHSGPVIIGTVGSKDRMDSTVLGDVVNLASRLEELTKRYHAKIIISSHTWRLVKEDESLLWRELDFVSVKGKDKPESIFEIFNADEPNIRDKKQQILKLYHEALMNYFSQNWDEAIKLFEECLKVYPQDIVSQKYLGRCMKFKTEPPGKDWNGALRLTEK